MAGLHYLIVKLNIPADEDSTQKFLKLWNKKRKKDSQ